MREIKFRVWSENLQKMSKPFGLHANVVDFTDENGLGSIKSLSSEVIMQYTGIKDRDGNEIYEGDILENVDFGILYEQFIGKGKVIFHCGSWSIQSFAKVVRSNMIVDLYGQEYATKIIGNVHENKGE